MIGDEISNWALLGSRVLPNNLDPVPQREPLIGIVGNRRSHRRVADTCRRRNHPPQMLVRLVPHLDPEGEIARMSCKFIH